MAAAGIVAAPTYFGQTHVIMGVSTGIRDGEFCVPVGPSGCGRFH